jgi:rubredoxin
VPEDASLDDFAVDDSDADDADGSSASDADGASDGGDVSADGSVDVADDGGVAVGEGGSTADGAAPGDASSDRSPDPATATYRWLPESAACPDCGADAERRWRDGDRFVCVDCKEW